MATENNIEMFESFEDNTDLVDDTFLTDDSYFTDNDRDIDGTDGRIVQTANKLIETLNRKDTLVEYSVVALKDPKMSFSSVRIDCRMKENLNKNGKKLDRKKVQTSVILVSDTLNGSNKHGLSARELSELGVPMQLQSGQIAKISPDELMLPSNALAGINTGGYLHVTIDPSDDKQMLAAIKTTRVALIGSVKRFLGVNAPKVAYDVVITNNGVKLQFMTQSAPNTSGKRQGVVNTRTMGINQVGELECEITLVESPIRGAVGVYSGVDVTPLITVTRFQVNNDLVADNILSAVLYVEQNWIRLLADIIGGNPTIGKVFGIGGANIPEAILQKVSKLNPVTGMAEMPRVAIRLMLQPDDADIHYSNCVRQMVQHTVIAGDSPYIYPSGKAGRLQYKNMGPVQFAAFINNTSKKNTKISALLYYNVSYANVNFYDKVKVLNSLLDSGKGNGIIVNGIAKAYNFGKNARALLTSQYQLLPSPSNRSDTLVTEACYTQSNIEEGW